MIRGYQVTRMFRSGHDCTSTSSARSHRYFLQADIAIWVLREVRVDTVLARARFHFCSRLHWRFMRRTGSVLILRRTFSSWLCRTTFINQILSEFLYPIRQFMRYISSYFFALLIFVFCFRFLWIHAAGLPEPLHSYFHFFLVLEF